MRSIIYTEGCLKGEVLCFLFGHKFAPVSADGNQQQKLQCKVCNHEISTEVSSSTSAAEQTVE